MYRTGTSMHGQQQHAAMLYYPILWVHERQREAPHSGGGEGGLEWRKPHRLLVLAGHSQRKGDRW